MQEEPQDINTQQKLGLMADLTRRFGALHEVQVMNLKRWPGIFLGVKTSQCEYDHSSRWLHFVIGAFFDNSRPDRFQERLEFLEKSCRMLLGGDIKISVTQFGRALYGIDRGEGTESESRGTSDAQQVAVRKE